MNRSVKIQLMVRNYRSDDSVVSIEGDANKEHRSFYKPSSFKAGLEHTLIEAFKDMVRFKIWKISCEGIVATATEENLRSLKHLIGINDEAMEILTPDGYRTFDFFEKNKVVNINTAIMLLVWKHSSFLGGDISSFSRQCVVCGKNHWGKERKLRAGLMPPTPTNTFPSMEAYDYPYPHCTNPNCSSHEIERMIDPEYVYTPIKEGEDLESALEKAIKDNPSLGKFTNKE